MIGYNLEQLRKNDDSRMQNGGGWGNHAKYYSVDDTVLYVGSQNFYRSGDPDALVVNTLNRVASTCNKEGNCGLEEFGLVYDDDSADGPVKVATEKYFNPLWKLATGGDESNLTYSWYSQQRRNFL